LESRGILGKSAQDGNGGVVREVRVVVTSPEFVRAIQELAGWLDPVFAYRVVLVVDEEEVCLLLEALGVDDPYWEAVACLPISR
jgi:hypothetical protein